MGKIHSLLAINMKTARSRMGISQAELAERCDLSSSYIGEVEIQRKFPSASSLERISTALNLKPYQLFFDVNDWENFDKQQILREISDRLKKDMPSYIDQVISSFFTQDQE